MIVLLLAPLVGFLINGLRFRSSHVMSAGIIGSAAIFISFISAVLLFLKFYSTGQPIQIDFFDWIHVGSFKASASFYVDSISSLMAMLITGVGFLIHVFSMGYMDHDPKPAKYFAYLNLFIFNMLVLVLGSNLLTAFVGWEGVGLCSYLLIGFWFTDKAKAAAGMKAFITNRIGDAGLLLGIFILFTQFGSVDFQTLNSLAPETPDLLWTGALTLAMLALFVGVTGKSAQIPLYVWLPDAMAGPTPVSALIHAATMVTAGVYLLIRMSPLLVMAPLAMNIIAIVGALTALMGASIAVTQWDIKKVLAYSTVSQLGYMILAVGVGAFGAGFFHLMTHAFFKALMFLGAGSIIHAMHHEQDMRKMGGLNKKMPLTYITFLCGWLAIIGFPPFSGFFSKDEIIISSLYSPFGHWTLWVISFLAMILTAFYMTRLMCYVFWQGYQGDDQHAPKESSCLMTIPLIILAIFASLYGFVGVPHIIGDVLGHMPNYLESWLHHSVAHVKIPHPKGAVGWGLILLTVGVVITMVLTARSMFLSKNSKLNSLASKMSGIKHWLDNKYYVDEFYQKYIIHNVVKVSGALWSLVDVNFIDRLSYKISDSVFGVSQVQSKSQSGSFQSYIFVMGLGALVIVLGLFFF